MNLECYFIDDEGEETLTELAKVRITPDSLVVIISHTHRQIYVYKGKETTIRQKFAGARSASMKRLDQGYKIQHVEEEFGIDESFKPILEFLGGIKTHPIGYVNIPRNIPRKYTKTVETMMALEPLEEATCEYLLAVNNCFEIKGYSKNDLRTGKFDLKETKGVPEKIFPFDNYVPRLLIAENKIVGIELWKKTS
ncbi:MAG: hypothetical protein KGD59_04405 [Candidatus Heimdallarchaeota archaeon]|nr:hypothetical protein [Candidatus Heimdallarchaeota archaeon]MBY8993768.1 hypothetical protein [Candidatus Heimdallarchaeota archaeon]